jgi:HTH-type transcriptional regulator/antitoxin HigA
MAQLALVDAYETFMQTAHAYVNLSNDEDYNAALVALEEILEAAEDTAKDPLNPLIEILSQAIGVYEEQDEELVAFLEEADATPVDVALLRTLMRQHELTGSDLPEIGDKTMVSKVLNGKRILQRHAMELLGERFGIRPAMFLGG